MAIEKLKNVSEQILDRLDAVRGKGEEATKQALVLPMIDALGYDIWNPLEVCPEYDADFAIKKAGQKEKVDTAILIGGVPRVFFEIKSVETDLGGHEGQLARYFNATPSATLGVLTNGVEWRFFTDTGDPNVMDAQPFHVVKLDGPDQGLEVLARFAKPVFSAEAIRDFATELLYTARMAAFLRSELDLRDKEPSDYFIRWILKSDEMYEGVVNFNVVERFKPIAKAALTRVIREIVRRSIAAMDDQAAKTNDVAETPEQAEEPAELASEPDETPVDTDDGDDNGRKRSIVTTEEELGVFAIVKEQFERSALADAEVYDSSQRACVPVEIAYKDTTGYFGVYFNKPSWWIMRVVMGGRTNWVGFNIDPEAAAPLVPEELQTLEPSPWASFRVAIDEPADLHKLHRLVFTAFQKTIDDHRPGGEAGAGPASPQE